MADYVSKFTGEEIDKGVEKALTVPKTINGAEFDGTQNINTKWSYNHTILANGSDNARYLDIVKLTNVKSVGNLTIIISIPLYDYGASANICVLSIGNSDVQNNSRIIATQIQSSKSYAGNLSFIIGYYDINNTRIFSIKVSKWSHNSTITVIQKTDNFEILSNQSYYTDVPDGFVEIPVRKLLANGEVNAASDLTGILPVANGGTGNASGTAEYLNYHIINANTDLNNIITSGFYSAPTGGLVSTIMNRPIGANQGFFMIVGYSYGPSQLLFTWNSHKFYFRACNPTDSTWTNWTEYLSDKGGAVNGLIENYGGIGMRTKYTDENATYTEFASFRFQSGDNPIVASCIISSAGGFIAPYGGIWLLEFGVERGEVSILADCIHPDASSLVKFGWWKDNDNIVHVGIYRPVYAYGFNVVPLNVLSVEISVNFSIKSPTTAAPTGWTEIPQRVLQDAEQVRAIVQEELAKRNL